MTKEEAIHEIEKVFEPAFANYIITALTEGATSSDKEQPPTLDTRQRERQIEMEYQHGYDKGWEDGRKALEQTELNPSYNSVKPELDCISRTDALNAFKPKGISEELWMESNTYKTLTKLSSVTPKTEWISVGERLPNEFTDVLCNTDSEEIFIATYLGKMNDGTDCFDDNNGMMWEGNIIAWTPLPEPYKEGE